MGLAAGARGSQVQCLRTDMWGQGLGSLVGGAASRGVCGLRGS